MLLPNVALSETQRNLICEVIEKGRGLVVVAGPQGSGRTTARFQLSASAAARAPGALVIDIGPGTGASGEQSFGLAARMGAAVLTTSDDFSPLELGLLFIAARRRLVIVEMLAADAEAALECLRSTYRLSAREIAETLQLVIALRRVRLLCQECKLPDEQDVMGFGSSSNKEQRVMRFRAVGCTGCRKQGYQGSATIAQTCQVTEGMRKLLRRGTEHAQIVAAARAEGAMEDLIAVADRALGPAALSEEDRLGLIKHPVAAAAAAAA